MHYCPAPGCPELVSHGRCARHAVALEHGRRNYADRRWYRTPGWKALRLTVLADAGHTCAVCRRPALNLEVDHIVKHDGDPLRFWDRSNLQALCSTCHAIKTRSGA